jgi:hypothetical protein
MYSSKVKLANKNVRLLIISLDLFFLSSFSFATIKFGVQLTLQNIYAIFLKKTGQVIISQSSDYIYIYIYIVFKALGSI